MTNVRRARPIQALAVAGLVLLLAGVASAGQGTAFVLQSGSVRLDSATVEAEFDALLVDAYEGTPAATVPAFSLHAGIVRIETDRSNATTPGVTAVGIGSPDVRTVHQPEITGTTLRTDHVLSVVTPHPGAARVSVTTECADVLASKKESVASPRFADARREVPRTPTADSLHWRDCGDRSHIRIEGDFILSLWEWDARLTTADGESDVLVSGYQPSETAPLLFPLFGEVRQHWLFVYDGVLSIPLGGDLYLSEAVAQTEVASLVAASGRIPSGETSTRVSGSFLDLQGDLRIGMKHVGDAVRTHVTGQLRSMEVDGTPVPLSLVPATTAPSSERGLLVPLLAGFLVVAGVTFQTARPGLVGAWVSRHRARAHRPSCWRERRAEGHRVLATRCERRGWDRSALRHAGKAVRLDPDNPALLVYRGILHRRRGFLRAALSDHRDAHLWLRIDPTDEETTFNAMEAARAAALAGESDTAFWWLGVAVDGEPDLATELDGEPDFSSLRMDLRYHQVQSVAQRTRSLRRTRDD